MEFLDRLLARTPTASPLKAGSLSELAADARNEEWIAQSVDDSSTQEASFATDMLLRGLQIADFIVTKIESEEPVLDFFAGTSRDVLLYEALHFSLHALSDELRRMIPADMISASIYFSDAACLAACELGRQHIGEFDPSLHHLDRVQRYLPHAGNLRELTECLIDILVSIRGCTSIQCPAVTATIDPDIEIQVSLRSTVHWAAGNRIPECAEILSKKYTGKFDRTRFDSDGPPSVSGLDAQSSESETN
jgi:hypothetical protein